MSDAEQSRTKGNNFFKAGDFAQANKAYSNALTLLASDIAAATEDGMPVLRDAEHKCRLNRAACLLKLQGYDAARRESVAVIESDEGNAKAHFRHGQALEALGQLEAAQEALMKAAKLNPQMREARELLDKVRARTKADPQFELKLRDLELVEDRALLALCHADLERLKCQMELLLKDARSNKLDHWEVRALLGLALLRQEEGEDEAVDDYLTAARRVLARSDSSDKRAEAYVAHVSAVIALDKGQADDARSFVQYGRILAEDMCDVPLISRFVGGEAAMEVLRRDWDALEQKAREAIELARSCNDMHGEAVHQLNLGLALRFQRRVPAALEATKRGAMLAQGYGYAHLLALSFQRFAILQIECGSSADRVSAGLDKLRTAVEISQKNGMRRAACDAQLNLHVAAMRYQQASMADCVAALEATRKEAREIGYGAAEMRADAALGGIHLGQYSVIGGYSEAVAGCACAAEPQLAEAEAAYNSALDNKSVDAAMRSQAYGGLAMVHLLGGDAKRGDAVRCAVEAREAGREARGGKEDATELTNLGIALILSGIKDDLTGKATGRDPLEDAIKLAHQVGDVEAEVCATSAVACLLEGNGELAEAYDYTERVLHLKRGVEGFRPESYQRIVNEAMVAREAGDLANALETLRRAEDILAP